MTTTEPRLTTRGWVVTVLAGASACIGGLVGALSLTRIAAESLGFPPGLQWTLTGAVDIGATAGAVLWVTSAAASRNRLRGVWLNIACSTISATGVGLDHATHAANVWWSVVAFGIGAFLPALSTWLIHVLAHLVTERADEPESDTSSAIEVAVAPPVAALAAPRQLMSVALSKAARSVGGASSETPAERRKRLDRERKQRVRAAAKQEVTA